MTTTLIIIIAAVVALSILLFIVYRQWTEHRVMKAREQQRLELTQNISHELKTPVASILGSLETILLHPDMKPEEQHEFLERAYQQAGRLSNLVEDIAMLNKLELKDQLYDRLEVELSSVVKNVVEDVASRVKELNATITYDVPAHIIISGNSQSSMFQSGFVNIVFFKNREHIIRLCRSTDIIIMWNFSED